MLNRFLAHVAQLAVIVLIFSSDELADIVGDAFDSQSRLLYWCMVLAVTVPAMLAFIAASDRLHGRGRP